MKKLLAILLCIMLLATALLSGCSVKTKNQVQNKDEAPSSTGDRTPIALTMVAMSSLETEANVVRDQLKKAGFDVTLNIQPDYGSLFTQIEARNYDINMGTYRVLTGNPDYGVRSLFGTDGEDNFGGIKNKEVDRLIDLGASQLPDDAISTYTELEKELVEKNAYFAPVCRMMYIYAFNKGIIDENTVDIGQSKYLYWTELDYVDPSLRDIRELKLTSERAVGQFDPVTQDGTFRYLANTNIKLLELTNNDEITTKGALAQGYAIAEGNSEFYMVLRDNVNFSTAKDKKAIDTGIRVGADDVIFTINRLKDKNAVPNHKVYDNYQIVKSIDRVIDISELETVKDSSTGKSIKEVLEKELNVSIKELMGNKESVNNSEGKYEVVKLITNKPFPQVLNYLCTYEAGILSKRQVESINNFDVASYDPSKDSRYGDVKFLKEGSGYTDEYLYCSGPYTILYVNDYEVVCQRNPGFMPGTDSTGAIKNIVTKLISDPDAAISALRSGEVDLVENVPTNQVSIVKDNSNLGLKSRLINGVVNVGFNLDDNKITKNEDIRKAVLYAINQDEIIAVKDGMGGKAYTTLTMLNTGNVQNADPAKVKQHLDNFYKSLEK